MGWGKPKYGSSTPKGQTKGIKEGDNIFRILPPMHSFAESGKWANYVTVHFGYSGVDSQDPSKKRTKPFRCIKVEDRRSNMVLEECPECTLFDKTTEQLKSRESEIRAELAAAGKSGTDLEEVLATALEPMRGWIKTHSPDRKHYLNVMSPDGKEFYHFKLSHRTKKQLDGVLKELSENEGIDGLDLSQGVLINIKRTGRFLAAQDVVTVVKEKVVVDGRKLEQIALRPLTDEEAQAALETCRDLAEVGGYVLTKEQITDLTECSGDPEEVDAIFNRNRKESSASPRPRPANDNVISAPPAPPVAPKAPPVVVEAPRVNPAIAARLAEIKAKKDAAEAAALAAAAEAAAAPEDEDAALGMSDEDFLAKFS